MKRPLLTIGVGVLTLTACWPVFAEPQPAASGIVAGTGTVEIKRRPEFLRVQVELLARGKDLKTRWRS